MKTLEKMLMAGLCIGLAVVPATAAGRCVINFVAHGTFQTVDTSDGTCLQFVDDLGNTWEITNPRGSWTDNLTGTVIASSLVAGECTVDVGMPLQVCEFDADASRNVVGTFDENQFVSCPGFVIRTRNATFRITNCDDLGPELCSFANVGRRIKAGLFVDAAVTHCIDPGATVLDFSFL